MPKTSKPKIPSKIKHAAKINNLVNNTIKRKMTGKKIKQGPIKKKITKKNNSLRIKLLKQKQENINAFKVLANTARKESQERKNSLQEFIEALKQYNNNSGGGAPAKKKSNSP